ncbi:MAG: hypothetical protein ACTSRP_08930 [Candidatus Helarchaeota archaeon]
MESQIDEMQNIESIDIIQPIELRKKIDYSKDEIYNFWESNPIKKGNNKNGNLISISNQLVYDFEEFKEIIWTTKNVLCVITESFNSLDIIDIIYDLIIDRNVRVYIIIKYPNQVEKRKDLNSVIKKIINIANIRFIEDFIGTLVLIDPLDADNKKAFYFNFGINTISEKLEQILMFYFSEDQINKIFDFFKRLFWFKTNYELISGDSISFKQEAKRYPDTDKKINQNINNDEISFLMNSEDTTSKEDLLEFLIKGIPDNEDSNFFRAFISFPYSERFIKKILNFLNNESNDSQILHTYLELGIEDFLKNKKDLSEAINGKICTNKVDNIVFQENINFLITNSMAIVLINPMGLSNYNSRNTNSNNRRSDQNNDKNNCSIAFCMKLPSYVNELLEIAESLESRAEYRFYYKKRLKDIKNNFFFIGTNKPMDIKKKRISRKVNDLYSKSFDEFESLKNTERKDLKNFRNINEMSIEYIWKVHPPYLPDNCYQHKIYSEWENFTESIKNSIMISKNIIEKDLYLINENLEKYRDDINIDNANLDLIEQQTKDIDIEKTNENKIENELRDDIYTNFKRELNAKRFKLKNIKDHLKKYNNFESKTSEDLSNESFDLLKEQISELKNLIEDILKEHDSINNIFNNFDLLKEKFKLYQEISKEIEELNIEKEKLKKSIKEKEKDLIDVNEKIKNLQEKINMKPKNKKKDKLKTNIKEFKAIKNKIKTEINDLKDKNTHIETKLINLEDDKKELYSKIRKITQNIAENFSREKDSRKETLIDFSKKSSKKKKESKKNINSNNITKSIHSDKQNKDNININQLNKLKKTIIELPKKKLPQVGKLYNDTKGKVYLAIKRYSEIDKAKNIAKDFGAILCTFKSQKQLKNNFLNNQ